MERIGLCSGIGMHCHTNVMSKRRVGEGVSIGNSYFFPLLLGGSAYEITVAFFFGGFLTTAGNSIRTVGGQSDRTVAS